MASGIFRFVFANAVQFSAAAAHEAFPFSAHARKNFQKFLQTLQGMTDKKYGRGASEEKGFTYRTLMLAGMHFMDSYNYDVERVKRCDIALARNAEHVAHAMNDELINQDFAGRSGTVIGAHGALPNS